ncbi:tyrosine-type recombinase/integrase [Pseudomonas gingeri]|uniref:tyrosine-type recombinase/integrase n=1 Tax=Pseudomonas gingeri TaxID=117681 RepID=UPI00159FA77C|nr:site-specific integrase [Pseudomonas gingeri]NWA03762.1 site-specific integrase [Pseudomonas gingeri]NWA14621.1 site-specific integrase [Pseudomonas gingeri]NWA58749.1 site-specific integrase [Pseudomonas gingeri]NWA94485.1 site-specific integrase [Pseudomonas gingeri]NWB01141.1 site-specific integrase [Pseudomonas gingeri]
MPYKRGKIWWISYTAADGTYVRRSAGTEDHSAAKAIEQEHRAQAWREKELGVDPPRTFEEVMVEYLSQAASAQKSFETTQYRVKALRDHFAGLVMNDLSGREIREYSSARAKAGKSPATINRELAALSAAINWCVVELEWKLPNPVKGRKMKEPEGRVRWITRAEVDALCRIARKQRFGFMLEDFIRLAVNTGCRKEEMLGLEWRRVDFANRLIYLDGEHTKASKRRSIPLNEGSLSALKGRMAMRAEHCPTTPWVFSRKNGARVVDLSEGFDGACEKAGITDFTIHDLRHTCAAWLVSSGVPLIEIRDLLGHSTIQMTEKYAHLAPTRVRNAVSVLDQPLSQSSYTENPAGLQEVGLKLVSA